jgi:hypothetical protein
VNQNPSGIGGAFGTPGGAGGSIIIGNYNQYVNCNNVYDG